MTVSHIAAAGGIVVRDEDAPRIAIVQLRKRKEWVLPKGKLNPDESAIAAARREVLEETGHKVAVHEFVGAISYEVNGKPKVVQFWRMQALGGPSRKLMPDVKAVSWLPLHEAVAKLTHPREKVFLAQVGPRVVQATRLRPRIRKRAAEPAAAESAVAPIAAIAAPPPVDAAWQETAAILPTAAAPDDVAPAHDGAGALPVVAPAADAGAETSDVDPAELMSAPQRRSGLDRVAKFFKTMLPRPLVR